MNCVVCHQAAVGRVTLPLALELPLCHKCLLREASRRGKRDLLVLALIWLPVATYTWLALDNPEIEGVWRFAAIAPAVLIALFLSAFAYQGIVDARRLQRGSVAPTLHLALQRRLAKLGLS